ncbi:hypothetical protein ACEPPN_015413 [Leptodophora sp. 'Broadleaf-Isolate-01']
MSSYPYSFLPPDGDNIRLLRLLPNEDEAAPLHCELRNYSLQKLGPRTHLYEALSYVWGDARETLPIYVHNDRFPVTVNLHAALSRLRDHSFERIIWVDAICINQKNLQEQSQQVQLMAKIYCSAHRVIVWLGEEAVGLEGALEDIRLAANKELTERSKKEINEQAILNLLQRPWFQRIWVLQEVAAARHVVIMCGSIEIDGYTFCLGLKSLKLSYTASPELQTVPSVTYLMEQASLRSKYTTNLPGRFSLNVRCLAELIDMFHTRKASDVRDKVYALLGMSSDDPGETDLRPDYEISWKELFQKLVKFVLSKDISVETSDDTQRAVIKSKGYILGQVSSVNSDETHNVNITFTSKNLGDKMEWALQASAKPIQERDIICLLHGASKPTIIRLCKDHFAVIVIAATPLNGSGSFGWPETSRSMTQFLRDFLLVWDWKSPQGESQDRKEYNALTMIYSQALEYSKEEFGVYLAEAIRLWNDIMILDDLGEYGKADERLLEARSSYMTAFKNKHQHKPNTHRGRTLLSFTAGEGYEDTVKLLLETGKVEADSKDGKSGRTPLSWAAEDGHKAIVKLLLETGQVEVNSRDKVFRWTPLSRAAKNGHEAVVKLLLETDQIKINLKDNGGKTPLSWAAKNGHKPIVKLLLETSQVEVNSKDEYRRTPLSQAAKNGHEAVVKLLLETGQVEVNSKDAYHRTPLSQAAENGHEAVVKLILETGQVKINSKDIYRRTPLSQAAENGHEAVVKLLLETGQVEIDSKDICCRTPLSLAVKNGHEAVVKLLLKTSQAEVDSKDNSGRTPLLCATENGHEAIVKLLLETSQVEVNSKDDSGQTPLSWAANNGHGAVVKLLLETSQVEINSKDNSGQTPLLWAANSGHGAVVKLLLETSQVEIDSKDKFGGWSPLSRAANNGHGAVVKLLLETGQVEIDSKDNSGRTPLSWAAKNGYRDIVKLLLKTSQAEVDSKDNSGRTPLSCAAENGHEAVVKLLLETGQVEVNSKDKVFHRTPLSWAANNGHGAIVRLLREHVN